MSNEIKPVYERSTGKLRQEKRIEWVGDYLCIYYVVQQEFITQDGIAYASPHAIDKSHEEITEAKFLLHRNMPTWVKTKIEWRDLPIVLGKGCEEEEITKE